MNENNWVKTIFFHLFFFKFKLNSSVNKNFRMWNNNTGRLLNADKTPYCWEGLENFRKEGVNDSLLPVNPPTMPNISRVQRRGHWQLVETCGISHQAIVLQSNCLLSVHSTSILMVFLTSFHATGKRKGIFKSLVCSIFWNEWKKKWNKNINPPVSPSFKTRVVIGVRRQPII